MIDIVCDNCEKTFSVDDAEAGGKVPCPDCGDVNRVPEQGGPESQGLPPEDGPEEDIIAVRPAMFRARPLLYTIIVVLFAAGVGGAIYASTRDMKALVWLSLAAAVLSLAWWTVWYVRHLGEGLRITNKRTIYRRGLLSRHTSEVLHNHIRNLQINQNLLQRICNVGDVLLDSSAGGGGGGVSAEIRVGNVPGPRRLKEIIDQYRKL